MGSYANAFSFLLVIVFLATLKVEARESKFFSKFSPQVDQPSSEIYNYNGYHFENRQSDIPTEEFIANINKDSAETNGFSGDFDEHSYVTVPQDNKEKNRNDFYYPANNGFELTAEEKKFFDEKEEMNGYSTGYKNDHENVHVKEAQGMSDTRSLENGKYYYKPTRVDRGKREYNEYFGNGEYKSNYNDFRPLKDFEYNPLNQMGFVP